MIAFMINISIFAIPVFILFVLGYGFMKGVKIYEVFVEGAKEGLTTSIRVLPYLVAMLVAVGIFRASGAMDLLIFLLSPITRWAGIPPEILPLAVMRPLSGAGATGVLAELLKTYGADSMVGRIASTLMGSTETIFYTLAVYFGSVGIKNIRHTLTAALIAELAAIFISVHVCRYFFG